MPHFFPSSEYRLLDSLKPFLNYRKTRRYPLAIGDDAAIRTCVDGEKLVLTADSFVQDVHFSLSYMTLEETGYKAMAINLSDIAAMAAAPDGALVQVIFPKNGVAQQTARDIRRLYKGIYQACGRWNFPIVGGNLSAGPCWIIDVTLLGSVDKRGRALLRTGAKHGDGLWVTGGPGGAAAGLAALRKWGRRNVPMRYKTLVASHVRPVPRIEAGLALGRDRRVHALIDVSDGISKECHTLAFENNLGILLDDGPARIFGAIKSLACDLKTDEGEWYLHGGEDYELLFAASRSFDPFKIIEGCGVPITRIGTFSKSLKGVRIRDNEGVKPLRKGGWDHLLKALPQKLSDPAF
jgi:thiamine-monophosphate kinase